MAGYGNLRGECAKRNIAYKDIAHVLHKHINTITNKMDGKTRFLVDEVFLIADKFFPDEDVNLKYLFELDEDKTA